MQIKEIQSREEISATFKVLVQIYEDLEEKTYTEDILNMMQRGYKMAGVFEDSKSGNLDFIGVVGVRIVRKLHHGKIIEIEDFMIDRKKRGIGVGKMLMRWVEWQATNFGCDNIIGTLETKRLESQKIFSREKFALDGFFFKKSC
ncbi:MAG: GNAT family N-acetyltransferase [Proteobacteria bacterium]|nr:GNAT family N-acetyltransferase [Pseudomonadota bacterium]